MCEGANSKDSKSFTSLLAVSMAWANFSALSKVKSVSDNSRHCIRSSLLPQTSSDGNNGVTINGVTNALLFFSNV